MTRSSSRRSRPRKAAGAACAALALVIAVAAPSGSATADPPPAEAAAAAGRCGTPSERPWCDTALSPDRRAKLLLAQLTRDERIELLGGDELFGIIGSPDFHTGVNDGVPRLGLPAINFSDGPVGPRQGPATALPSPLGLAATWDPRMATLHAGVVGDEVRKKGNDVVFAPTIETLRVPMAGRSFENYGEDPFLSSQLTVAWIRSIQRLGVIATVKHFVPNSQEGTGPLANLARPGVAIQGLGTYAQVGNRMSVSANLDERTLRELYLPQFEAAVKRADAGAVMCAYNKLNGVYACENGGLLEHILRGEWGFEGFTVADYNGAHDTGASLTGGLDFEPWPGLIYNPILVEAMLASGAATMADVDRHVLRYLRTLFAYGTLDRPAYADDESAIDKVANARTSQRIEESAITLLRNDGVLPLDASKLDSVALIGAGADTYVHGGGSSEIDAFSFVTPLESISKRLGRRADVAFADGSDIDEAATLARESDVAILFIPDYETEGVDRACLSLDCPPVYGDQDALIEKVAASNPKTVVVLETGAPVLTPWRNRLAALLEAWYPGANAGPALTRVLFGDVDPGGRLPATFPGSEAQLPTAGDPNLYPGVNDDLSYGEAVFVGYRHYDQERIRPAFPFGHGLSYTRFRFRQLRVEPGAKRILARVSATVTNTGDRKGFAVPQLYLGLPQPSAQIPQPPRQLRGFDKLALEPGEQRSVHFTLNRRELSYWDPETHRWRLEPGAYRVYVGSSSRRLALQDSFSVGVERANSSTDSRSKSP